MRDDGMTVPAAPEVLHAWLSGQVPAFNMWMAMNRTILRGTGEALAEWSSFLMERWREDLALHQQLVRCDNPADMQRILTAFFERGIAQYQGEFQRLGAMGSRLSRDIADGMKTASTNAPC